MNGCKDCESLTSGRCAKHSVRVFTVGPDGQLVEVDPIQVRPPPTGWMCPGCGCCYSPYVSQCSFCGPKTVTIDASWLLQGVGK